MINLEQRYFRNLFMFMAKKIKFDIVMHEASSVNDGDQVESSLDSPLTANQQGCILISITEDAKSAEYQILLTKSEKHDENLTRLQFSLARCDSRANTENINISDVVITLSDFVQEIKQSQITISKSVDDVKKLINEIVNLIVLDYNRQK